MSWNPRLRGALRSTTSNRQWPQVRCFRASLTVHPKCMSCVYDLAAGRRLPSSTSASSVESVSSAMPLVLEAGQHHQMGLPTSMGGWKPRGLRRHSSNDRIWRCPWLETKRAAQAPVAMTTAAGGAVVAPASSSHQKMRCRCDHGVGQACCCHQFRPATRSASHQIPWPKGLRAAAADARQWCGCTRYWSAGVQPCTSIYPAAG